MKYRQTKRFSPAIEALEARQMLTTEQQWLPGTFVDGTFTFYAEWTDVPGARITAQFGVRGDTPIVGDWDGDGEAQVGVHRGDTFFFDSDANRAWTSGGVDKSFKFGAVGDQPIVGAWTDSSTRDRVGIYRNGFWWLDANEDNIAGPNDLTFNFGQPDDKPVTGDWDHDGVTDIGVYSHGQFLLDTNGNHHWDDGDKAINFGMDGDTPITASNYSTLTVNRNGKFYNDHNKNRKWGVDDSVITFGESWETPVSGLFYVPRGTGEHSNAGFDWVISRSDGGIEIVSAKSISEVPEGTSGVIFTGGPTYLPSGTSGVIGTSYNAGLSQGTSGAQVSFTGTLSPGTSGSGLHDSTSDTSLSSTGATANVIIANPPSSLKFVDADNRTFATNTLTIQPHTTYKLKNAREGTLYFLPWSAMEWSPPKDLKLVSSSSSRVKGTIVIADTGQVILPNGVTLGMGTIDFYMINRNGKLVLDQTVPPKYKSIFQ